MKNITRLLLKRRTTLLNDKELSYGKKIYRKI